MFRALRASLLSWISLSMVLAAAEALPSSFLASLAELVSRHGFAADAWLAECRRQAQTHADGSLPESLAADLPRIVETLRRERQAEDLRRLHDYRRLRMIPTFAAAGKAVGAAAAQVEQLRKTACGASPAVFAEELAEADERLQAAWDLTDRHWPDDLPVRVGVGPGTFGRFGWRSRFAGLVWDLADWNRLARPDAVPALRFSPPGAELAGRQPATVNWVSARHEMTLVLEGREVPWNVTESVLVPAVLVETGADSIQVSRGDERPQGPDRVLVPVRDTALSVRFVAGRQIPLPEDNWLLLAWERIPHTPPVLVVFDKLPSRIGWTEEGLTAEFAGPAEKIVLGSYNGTAPWSPEESQSWQAVARPVLKRCRALVSSYADFPVEIEELYSVDESRGEVRVACRPTYTKLAFAGHPPKQSATPLAPALGTAVQGSFPAGMPQLAQEWILPTRSGAYRASTGPNATLRLPICRYDHPVVPVPADLPAKPLVLPEPIGLDDLSRLLSAWPGFSADDRRRLGVVARDDLVERLALVRQLGAHMVEPNSLTLYVDLVAVATGRGGAASVREAGLLLDATYRYAKMSGDWDLVRAHWVALRDLLDAQTAMTDWPLMSPLPRDAMAADVLADALRGAVAMGQMAEAIEETETLRLARYLTARLTVPYAAGFATERATPENRMAEFGAPAAWSAVPFLAGAARVAGTPMFPELVDLAAVHCDFESRHWMREALPKAFADWATEADALAAGEYCLTAATMGVPPEPPVMDAVAARLGPASPLARQLIGLGATPPPLRLAEWQPAALGACVYDDATRTVRVELDGATCLRIVTQFAPAEIRDNGAPLPQGAWSHSFERARLVLPLQEGKHELEFVYSTAAPQAP